MSTPYNPGQNPENNPDESRGNSSFGQNPRGENPYGTNPGEGSLGHHPEGVSEYGGYAGQQWQQANYAQGEAGNAGYSATGGNYGTTPISSGYEPEPGRQQTNGVALAAMILGILALLGLVFILPGFILGLIALILGIMGVRRANAIAGPGARRGMAITGIVTGAISLILSALMLIFGFSVAKQLVDDGVFEACEQYQDDDEQLQACFEDEVERSLNN
ncbi:DUF4190 domain-containing protein [Corynebacterium ureicelerivorans]